MQLIKSCLLTYRLACHASCIASRVRVSIKLNCCWSASIELSTFVSSLVSSSSFLFAKQHRFYRGFTDWQRPHAQWGSLGLKKRLFQDLSDFLLAVNKTSELATWVFRSGKVVSSPANGESAAHLLNWMEEEAMQFSWMNWYLRWFSILARLNSVYVFPTTSSYKNNHRNNNICFDKQDSRLSLQQSSLWRQ